jgi:hypothetical protein
VIHVEADLPDGRDVFLGPRRSILLERVHPHVYYVETEGVLSIWSWNVMLQSSQELIDFF